MLNNSGNYGPNEAPTNMVASIIKPQSTSSNINHNSNNFGKIIHQAAFLPGVHYEAHNFANYEPPNAGVSRIIHPFQGHQTMGHASYLPQTSPFIHENANDYLSAVSTNTQAEHHNTMLNFHQNFLMNATNDIPTVSHNEPGMVKGYPINTPQMPTRVLQNNSTFEKNIFENPQNDQQSNAFSSRNTPPISTDLIHKFSNNEKNDLNNPENLSLRSKTLTDNINNAMHSDSSKDSSHDRRSSSDSKEMQKSDESNADKRTTSICYEDISFRVDNAKERKRKSLEKTVRLIESILIKSTNNNTKPDITGGKPSDPLAFSPKPDLYKSNLDDDAVDQSDSDEEVLVKKVPPKKKRKISKENSPSKKITSTRRSHVIENETEVQLEKRLKDITDNITVKVEFTNLSDIDYGNPFHRDTNGVSRKVAGDATIVDMENSVETALDIIKNGTSTVRYFECPNCCLLLSHPKRFLVHIKWHSFGLLNDKRAEIAKEKEDRIKEKREARMIQRLSTTEGTGADEGIFPCKDCDKAFQTKSSLKGHRRREHPPEVSECRICLAPVRDARALREHLIVHQDTQAGGHQCPNCPKRFKYRHSLAKHVDTHLEKTHACPECSKMFGSAQLVKLHMKTHERVARGTTFHCSYCGKGFYETYNLNVHERTHRQEKPYKCDICESCFVTNSSLKRHVKVSHCGAKPHTCPECLKCFSTESIRDRHVLRAHSDQGQFPHQCQLCTRRYMKPKDLRNHMYKMHPKEKKKRTASDTEPLSS